LPGRRTGLVTGFARIAAVNVIDRFTRSDYSIVTAETGANDLSMVNVRNKDRCPYGSTGVAGFTQVGSINVVR